MHENTGLLATVKLLGCENVFFCSETLKPETLEF